MKDFYYYRLGRKPLIKRDEIVTEKILELANLVATALAFSQLLGDDHFESKAFFAGGGFFLVAYMFVWYYLSRRS